MSMNLHRIAPLLAICLLLLPGCAARRSTGSVNLHASMTQTVLVAEASYETILKGLGDSFRAGVIDRETLDRGKAIGVETHDAIDTTKATLRAYLRAGALGGTPTSVLFQSLATMSTLISKLQEFYGANTGALVEVQ